MIRQNTFRLTVVSTLLLALSSPQLSHAQDTKSDIPSIPVEVQALINDISDIDKLRALVPLKLNSDQIQKMIDAMTKAQIDYNQHLIDATVPPIKKLAEEIKEVRRKVLAGGTIPKDFDARVQKIEMDYYDRRASEDTKALKILSDSMRTIFTREQIAKAAAFGKQAGDKLGKNMKGTDDQFFNYFVQGVLIQYSGIVKLLKDMKVNADQAANSSLQTSVGAIK